jgi:ApbE superfamily uncharacterized protein (UPF0280 family)
MPGLVPTKSITSNLTPFQVSGGGLIRQNFQIDETMGVIISDDEKYLLLGLDSIRSHRKALKDYITENPSFEHSYDPIEVEDVPEVVKRMSEASMNSGVGPMAAVAGVIADLAAETMVEAGAKVAVIENGGEIIAFSDRALKVAVGAGTNPLSNKVGFLLDKFPVGVATSSGRHSHAFSMGDADTVTIFAENAGLADAVATASANVVLGEPGTDVKTGVDTGMEIKGVFGVLAIRDDKVSIGGAIPQILSVIGGDSD